MIDALERGFSDAPAEDLLRTTTRLRSAILLGLAVLNELQTQAAKLEEIAAIREARVIE